MDGSHLVLIGLDSFLVLFFGLLVHVDLLLDLSAYFLVPVDLNDARILQVVDFFLERAHPILETLAELCTQFLFLIEHFFVLQVEVMILLENGLAEAFEHLPLLDAGVVLAHHGVARRQLLLPLPDCLAVALQRLPNRVFHDLTELFRQRVQPVLRLAQSGRVRGILPLVHILLQNLFELLRFLLFEFVL